MSKEQVLVFPAHILNEEDFESSPIISDKEKVDDYLVEVLYGGQTTFWDREQAEKDPSVKQIIPYCVLTHEGEVFAYSRSKKGGENRLHDKWSIGVGGHINPIDGVTSQSASFFAGLRRELHEEVSIHPSVDLKILKQALIYDNSNEVGKVHFAIVNVLEVPDKAIVKPSDEALSNAGWYTLPSLLMVMVEDKMENWSKLAFELL